jgi:hypothetical protein
MVKVVSALKLIRRDRFEGTFAVAEFRDVMRCEFFRADRLNGTTNDSVVMLRQSPGPIGV